MPVLTADEFEVLRDARASGIEWMRPMDLGGHDGSHHSRAMAGLVKLGLMERKDRSLGLSKRGSYLYRLTEAGLKS